MHKSDYIDILCKQWKPSSGCVSTQSVLTAEIQINFHIHKVSVTNNESLNQTCIHSLLWVKSCRDHSVYPYGLCRQQTVTSVTLLCPLTPPRFRVGRHIYFAMDTCVCPPVYPSVCLSQNCDHVTWKLFEIFLQNLTEVFVIIRWRAEQKNHNSSLRAFWVMALWTM